MQSKTTWIDDVIITAAQNLLQKQYPSIGGLQVPCLTLNLAMTPPKKEFIQVFNVSESHWITISTVGCHHIGTVEIYD